MKRTNSEKNDRRRSWDKTTILTALRARRDRGLEMSAQAVRRSDSGLETAIRRHFSSFREALRAANIEWVPPPKHCIWDKSKIVAALRDRRSNGLEMHFRAVRGSDARLCNGIRYHFGSFDAALRAAGIDPAATRKRSAWDKDRVVAELRSRRERGLDLSTGAIQKSQPRLAGAIFRHFRYHDQPLLAAGIDPATARHAITWDKSMVLVELRRRHAAGEPLSTRLLYQQAANLYGAAWRLFGTYSAALCAAGIDPEQIKAPWPVVWPTERILAGIREHYDRWWSVHPRNEPPRREFQGVEAAQRYLEFIGQSVTGKFKQGGQNPVRYLNC